MSYIIEKPNGDNLVFGRSVPDKRFADKDTIDLYEFTVYSEYMGSDVTIKLSDGEVTGLFTAFLEERQIYVDWGVLDE